jgi:kumamolisin
MTSQHDRMEFKDSERKLPAGARKIGPADLQEQIEVTIRLRRGSAPEEFQAHAAAAGASRERTAAATSLGERRYLRREEFAATHGASAEDTAKIRTFAAANGLTVREEDRARRSVKLSGTVDAFAKAFGVQLDRYEINGQEFRGRTGTLQIPADLAPIIEAVLGLDNRPQAKPHFRRRRRPAVADVSYTALQVATAYDFPTGFDGTGQSIAILELGGGYNATDLNNYFKNLGITTMPQVSAISVDGATNAPTGSADGPDGEVELDIEVSGAIAPGAKIGVYFAPNTDQGFVDALTTAIHDMTLKPSIVSISWGGPESSWTAQARNSLNSACEDAATMGVTVLVASGDNGATDGVSGNALTVDFPASSPFVTGCGGTTLRLSGSSIASETVWNELSTNEGATGGGVSEVFAVPAFQSGVNVPTAPNQFKGRGVPDVAGDADPSTGYAVTVDGSSTIIGGTSAVAPLWAGMLARFNQSLGKAVGYLNPLIYTANAETAFHPITSGNNGGYAAGPGWNPCDGLGSPNGAKLLAALTASAATKPVTQSRSGS